MYVVGFAETVVELLDVSNPYSLQVTTQAQVCTVYIVNHAARSSRKYLKWMKNAPFHSIVKWMK